VTCQNSESAQPDLLFKSVPPSQHQTGQTGRALLVRLAGRALAELGVSAPSDPLLEPIARPIHDLVSATCNENEQPAY
jgi:hypothetical protein